MARDRGRVAAAALTGLLVLAVAAGGVQAAARKITITMREYSYTPARVVLRAGEPVEIRLVNRGKLPHEFMVYDMPMQMSGMGAQGHGYAEKSNYFRGIPVQVTGGKVRQKGGHFLEVEVAAGKSATIAFTPTKKGTFEMACLIRGHYEKGQKGVFVVE